MRFAFDGAISSLESGQRQCSRHSGSPCRELPRAGISDRAPDASIIMARPAPGGLRPMQQGPATLNRVGIPVLFLAARRATAALLPFAPAAAA
jgi:hypothetical protein